MDGTAELQRFLDAQVSSPGIDQALAELRAGRKRSHWIWYVFPQIAGLGSSPMSRRFAISGLAEARAYADHPELGPRLREAARAVLAAGDTGDDAETILGGIDAMKLRSSMTLFHLAVPDEPVFTDVLERYFGGELDEQTRRRVS